MYRVLSTLTTLALVILICGSAQAVTSQQVVGQISQTSLQSYLAALPTHLGDNRAFDYTRVGNIVTHGKDHDTARDEVFVGFRRSGWLTGIDPFYITDTSGYIWGGENIVAIKQGTTRPDDIYLISSHYDSTANHESSWTSAPGANDNASGTAGLLEMARVLSQYTFDATIVFVAFDGEETTANGNDGITYRRIGSTHYAIEHQNDRIQAMISFDMVAFNDGTNRGRLETGYSQNAALNSQVISALSTYGGLGYVSYDSANYSDHVSFATRGFPALMLIESGWYPTDTFYHTQQDAYETPGNISFTYWTKMVKAMTGWLCDQAHVNGTISP